MLLDGKSRFLEGVEKDKIKLKVKKSEIKRQKGGKLEGNNQLAN